MSNFPLYDNLLAETDIVDDLTENEKTELIKLIKSIDNIGAEYIYVLIRIYQLENSDDKSTFKLPYGGKYIKNDVKFDLNELPNKLKQMLFKFVKKHINIDNDKK